MSKNSACVITLSASTTVVSELAEDHSPTHTHSPIYPCAHQVLQCSIDDLHNGYVMTHVYVTGYDYTTELTMRTTHTCTPVAVQIKAPRLTIYPVTA